MKKQENSIVKLIEFGPLIFIPLFVAIVIIFIVKENEENFNRILEKVEHNLIKSEKESTQSKVDGISNLITYQNQLIIKKLTLRVKQRVLTAHKISTSLYEQYKNKKSKKEIQEIIKTTLRPLLWNSGESFIFILNYNGIFQLAPKYLKHLENKSILNIEDKNGKFIIKEEIAMVKKAKEGFLWNNFTKPSDSSKKEYKQVTFVKDFAHFDWYMGSGEYLDTASKTTDKELLNSIKKISSDSRNYLFVSDFDGNILLNESTPKLAGKNYNKLKDSKIKNVYSLIHKSIEDKGNSFIEYMWRNPKNNYKENKYSYVRKIENTNWIIGSGFYESDIKTEAAKQTVKLYEDYNLRINYILSIGFASILVSLIFSYFISRFLKKSFVNYRKSITKKSDQLQLLNQTLEQKVKKRTKELQKSKEALEVLATTDSLTKINNRYSIMKILDNEISRIQRYKHPLCVLLYDIDKFKNVNDTYGHDIGDVVLITLTNVVNSNLRDTDNIGRYGGEEFLVIFPNTSLEDAKIVSERIRKNVEEYEFDKVKKITISLGLVEYKEGENADKLFKRLDELLYKSKDNGRNQLSY